MSVLLWVGGDHTAGKKLRRIVERVVRAEDMEIFHSLDALRRRLRQPGSGDLVLVFLAATQNDLTDALSIRDLLKNMRIILVLPDNGKETIAQGHLLGPRFLTDVGGNMDDVGSVLDRMLRLLGIHGALSDCKTVFSV